MKEHRSKFRWGNFDPDNPEEFKKKVEQAGVLNRRIDVIEKEVRVTRKELEENLKNLHEYQELLQKIQLQMVESKSRYETVQPHLKQLKFEEFVDHSQ